jgi:molybdopterin-guanine dinucleotide biosynthesis protein A
MPVAGVLLAGGLSSRLGQPKYLLDFGGKPLGLVLLERLKTVCPEVLIVSNDSVPFCGWGARVVPDRFPGCGPLAGLHAGLSAASGGDAIGILAVACDLPFFSAEFGRYLAGELPGYDAVIPRRGPFLEPLCAAYGLAALAAMEAQLASSDARVAGILPGLRVRYIDEGERRRFGPDEALFMNINNPSDLESARARWAAQDGVGIG